MSSYLDIKTLKALNIIVSKKSMFISNDKMKELTGFTLKELTVLYKNLHKQGYIEFKPELNVDKKSNYIRITESGSVRCPKPL